jgi:hypothetical protein
LSDKPDFLHNQGVLFVMTDGGKIKPLPFTDEEGNVIPNPYPDILGPKDEYTETLVLRSAGMLEVSRRLAMPVLDAGA